MLNHQQKYGGRITRTFARVKPRAVLPACLCLALVSCGGSSGEGNPPTISNDVVVSIAVNSESATGIFEWDSYGSDVQSIGVAIPEDTSLELSVGNGPTELPVTISSFPESGPAVIGNGLLVYTPNENFFGSDRLRLLRGDTEYVLNILVLAVNDAPIIVGDIDRVAEQGSRYSFQLGVRNVDQDQLQYSSNNLPSWLTLNARTGFLSGTPQQADVGVHENIDLIVQDVTGLSDSLTGIVIEVIDVNDAPTLNITQFPEILDARDSLSVNVFPDDIDGDSVSLVVEPNDFVATTVTGGTVTLNVEDVLEVTEVNLVLIATDQLGDISREIIPLKLYPLTASGRGRTVKGKKSGSGIHLVVLGDGYRSDQISQFREDVSALISTMKEDPAVALHFSAWNIHLIETPSVDSGIDDDVSEDIRKTVFNAGYFCLSVPRLICGDNNAMFDVALDEFPDVDELVLLVNDPRYGGSGGSVAIASSSAPEIALHELGHSLAELADEYVDNSIPAISINEFTEGAFANVSSFEDPELVPWRAWIDLNNSIPSQLGDDGVGVFQGGYYDADAFYRPTYNSRMRTFDSPFGPVNGEAWALSVYKETNPVATFSPRTEDILLNRGEVARFSVEPIFGPDIQRIVWTLNGNLLADQINATELPLTLGIGQHSLALSVNDFTGAIRTPGPNAAQFVWRWDITVQ